MSKEKNIRPLKKIWDWAGSRELSVFIFITAITYSVIAYVFSLLVPPMWFKFFQTLLPLTVLYIAFFVNLLICEIKWLPVVFRRCRRPFPPEPEDLARFSGKMQFETRGDADRLKSYLSRRFYTVASHENEGKEIVHAYRGITAPVGNLLFHLSFFILLIGIFLSIYCRIDGKARVAEGTIFDGGKESYESLTSSPLAALPDVRFSVDTVSPSFWGNQLLFTDLRADLALNDGSKGSAWLSKPVKINGARVTIAGLGNAARYVLKDKEGNVLAEGMKLLNNFLPGSEDGFNIPGYPHRFQVAYYPDSVVKGDNVSNRSMNRINPVIGLRVYRGRFPVFTGPLKEGEYAEFDNLKLTFNEVRYWGDFKILKNPGFLWIWVAFAMMVSGLIWRFVFFKREVVVIEENGQYFLYCRSDLFPRLFEERMREICRD